MNIAKRDKYTFIGTKAEDSAKYYDIVTSRGYTGNMDYLAWDSANKFGTRMTSIGIASFRDGITIGENALLAANLLDEERNKAWATCEEFGRRQRMNELMAKAYEIAKDIFSVEIELF